MPVPDRSSHADAPVDRPLHLTPVLVAKPWGGRRLAELGRQLPADTDVGESWDVADLAPDRATSTSDPSSRVAAGPHTGRTLAELIATDGSGLLGAAAADDGRFPVLVKLLDAREPLSIQVHPPAAYVADHPEVHLKTESWVVLDADPGAELLIGLRPEVTRDQLRAALGTPAMVPLLRRVPAVPGEAHHLPAGTIHALGGGVLVAEVQTPSDTTFRVYDWTEELGRAPRELHLEAAMACIELGWDDNLAPPTPASATATLLAAPAQYRVTRHHLDAGGARGCDDGRVRVLHVLDGEVAGADLAWPLTRGGVVVLPAAWRGELHATAAGAATLLETTV